MKMTYNAINQFPRLPSHFVLHLNLLVCMAIEFLQMLYVTSGVNSLHPLGTMMDYSSTPNPMFKLELTSVTGSHKDGIDGMANGY
uniref:Uncharacterized protein n=1 Tax=Tetranychus urticae TaxID=32264 RepID=T1KGB7_TETUR